MCCVKFKYFQINDLIQKGVDLINTYYRWAWSPSQKTLNYDFVRQHRSTWDDEYDGDTFLSTSKSYSSFNLTHVIENVAGITRESYDNGKNIVNSNYEVNYYWK
jgi:hypothetical protein